MVGIHSSEVDTRVIQNCLGRDSGELFSETEDDEAVCSSGHFGNFNNQVILMIELEKSFFDTIEI